MAGEMSLAINRMVASGEWVRIAESFSSATFPPPIMSTRRLSSFTNTGKSLLASSLPRGVLLLVLDFIYPLTGLTRSVRNNYGCTAAADRGPHFNVSFASLDDAPFSKQFQRLIFTTDMKCRQRFLCVHPEIGQHIEIG